MRTLFKDGLIGGWIAWTRPVATPTPRPAPRPVPAINSTNNQYFNEVIGNKEDNSFSNGINLNNFHPSIVGHLKAAYYHVHGSSFTIPDDAPITLTPGNAAYAYGTPVEIGTLGAAAFDIHWVQVSDMTANNSYYNIQLCNIDGTNVFGKTSCFRSTNFTQEGNVPIQIPPLAAGTVVYARVGASTGNVTHTVKIKLFAHPYNDIT